ncbi:MAG: Flp/Fap pilin component [Actinomycetota bacterium]|jgi:pilus assembly protein Flp/PilA|nr:Flp/Fap pilin component [Actinomycetota bacterium]
MSIPHVVLPTGATSIVQSDGVHQGNASHSRGEEMQDVLLKLWCSSITRMQEMKDSQSGATAVEYGIMVALIAAVIITVVKVVGGKTSNAFESVNSNLP